MEGKQITRFLFWEKEVFPRGARREGWMEDARPRCCVVPMDAGGLGWKSLNTWPSMTVIPAFLQAPQRSHLEAGVCSLGSPDGGLRPEGTRFLVFICPCRISGNREKADCE